MVFIIKDKIYDTETSEEIVEYRKAYPTKIFGQTFYVKRETTLYKTQKGNWFSVIKGDNDRCIACKETEDSVKELLKQLNAVDIYSKYFGQLEEA